MQHTIYVVCRDRAQCQNIVSVRESDYTLLHDNVQKLLDINGYARTQNSHYEQFVYYDYSVPVDVIKWVKDYLIIHDIISPESLHTIGRVYGTNIHELFRVYKCLTERITMREY